MAITRQNFHDQLAQILRNIYAEAMFSHRSRCPAMHEAEPEIFLQCSLEMHDPEVQHLARDPRSRKFVHWKTEIHKSKKPFVGWRCWRLGTRHLYSPKDDSRSTFFLLQSTAATRDWVGPVMRTKDDKRVAPAFNLSYAPLDAEYDYGVFSYKSPVFLLDNFPGTSGGIYPLGRLDLTGHIVEHRLGWRSQRAIIRELWLPQLPESQEAVQNQLETRYSCPVHILPTEQIWAWADYHHEEQREKES